jgi:hypothetical protein
MTFHVGQKVVCIRSGTPPNGETPPLVGAVYTVRDIVDRGHKIGIRLVEIKNRPRNYGVCGYMECTFSPKCFRPIVSRKTDISIFTEMLTNAGVDA